jgi:guanine deaminase
MIACGLCQIVPARLIEEFAAMSSQQPFLQAALELAYANVERGGRPFGAVVVRDGKILATGVNEVLNTNDPTAHAELMAIRAASQKLGSPNLAGCAVFASGHPCPMCMAAMRLAGVTEITYAYSNDDGAPYGLSTAAIYADLAKPFPEQSMQITYLPVRLESRVDLYAAWRGKGS